MPAPVLATKLHVPRLRSDLVSRSALVDKLVEGVERKLTLVAAPAGYGKTTLVTEFVDRFTRLPDDRDPTGVGWLSLDADDSDPNRFLAGMVAAVNSTLTHPTSLDPGASLGSLINGIAALDQKVILVIDDYHVIDSAEVDDMVKFLVDHMPSRLHLVITTRADPSLPLARHRANREVVDVRAADLRFSVTECTEFLNGTMSLGLTVGQVAKLEAKTEGWVAALNLAALSLMDAGNVAESVESISGQNRHVADYLVEEALNRQTDEVREFLVRTSILPRMTGPLCDALTGRSDGEATLELLHRANTFTAALDQDGIWYRYHHLFADLLRQRLEREGDSLARELHGKASAWHESQGNLREAIDHAARAHDPERLVGLVEVAIDDVFLKDGDAHSIVRWLDPAPGGLIKGRPRLALAYAWSLYYAGRVGEIESLLAFVEESATPTEDPDIVADATRVRAILAAARGDAGESQRLYERSGEICSDTDWYGRGMAGVGTGYARLLAGETEPAIGPLTEAAELPREWGQFGASLVGRAYLGFLHVEQGAVGQALQTWQRALEIAERWGLANTPIMGTVHAGLADLWRERNNLEQAREHASRAEDLRRGSSPVQAWFSLVLTSLVKVSDGFRAEALEMLSRAMSVTDPVFLRALWSTTRACQVLAVMIGGRQRSDANAAADREIKAWLDSLDLSSPSCPSRAVMMPGRGPEFISHVAARALIRWGETDRALALLSETSSSARAGGRGRVLLESLVLQSLASQASCSGEDASAALQQALELARPHGYVRIFVDEGPVMARMLYDTAASGPGQEYCMQLLAAFPAVEGEVAAMPAVFAANSVLFEPLSERELDVLRLVAQGLSNGEIGETLFISAQTVKTHVRNLYAKLDAHSRTGAVHKARGLGLLPVV